YMVYLKSFTASSSRARLKKYLYRLESIARISLLYTNRMASSDAVFRIISNESPLASILNSSRAMTRWPLEETGIGSVIPCKSPKNTRSEEHTSELQSRFDLVCRLLLEKKNRLDMLPVALGAERKTRR